MTHPRTRPILLALALLALPGGLAAQQADHAGHAHPAAHAAQAGDPAQVQQWLDEMQQLHQRLAGLQQQALQDPQIRAAEQALGVDIKVAMDEADPQLERSSARITELESQARAAQEAGDEEKLQELGAEAQQIQMQFLAAQEKALQRPDLAAQVEAFQARLRAKMVEIDAGAEQAIARFRELEEKVAATTQRG